MSFTHNPPRRQFLQLMMVSGALLAAPRVMAAGDAGSSDDSRDLRFASLDEALNELGQLTQGGEPVSHATWNWAQTLTHCAQSIEFSLTGFPQPKSALFQNTVGAAAFAVFAWRGRMSHDLAEPIPGAPSLDDATDRVVAEARLRAAVQSFLQWQGELKPHFAYGDLTKAEYELAHAMHLANHLSFFHAPA